MPRERYSPPIRKGRTRRVSRRGGRGAFPAASRGAGLHLRPQRVDIGFQPVAEGSKPLGMLFVESDLGAMYARIRLYALIVLLVIGISLPVSFLISRRLQHQLLRPILALAETTRAVSERHDYTVRAQRTGAYEFDLFTDTFNQMLTEIQQSEGKLHAQLGRLSLLQQITRATGERQDMPSIFQVVLGSLEETCPSILAASCCMTRPRSRSPSARSASPAKGLRTSSV